MAEQYNEEFDLQEEEVKQNSQMDQYEQEYEEELGQEEKSPKKPEDNSFVQISVDNDEYSDQFHDQPSGKKNENIDCNMENKEKAKQTGKKIVRRKFVTIPAKKYREEVQAMFPDVDARKLKEEKVQRLNDKIKETIKNFSEYLDNLITKKIKEASLHSNSKKNTVEGEILILNEEKRNSTKLEERLENQLTDLKNKEDLYKKHDDQNTQKEMEKLQLKIKNSQKQIHHLKLEISLESKKLTNQRTNFTDKDTKLLSQQMTIIKNNIGLVQSENEKNEEKMVKLNEKQIDLTKKLKQIQSKEKEATKLKEQEEEKLSKNKNYMQVKKKHDNASNHKNTTIHLWEKKGKVIEYENERIRVQLKNMDLQVRNFEDSINSNYEKSLKAIEKMKGSPETSDTVLKALNKISDNMKVYPNENQRSFSKSEMSKLTPKKGTISKRNSSHSNRSSELSEKYNDKNYKQIQDQYENQFKENSRQSDRSFVSNKDSQKPFMKKKSTYSQHKQGKTVNQTVNGKREQISGNQFILSSNNLKTGKGKENNFNKKKKVNEDKENEFIQTQNL